MDIIPLLLLALAVSIDSFNVGLTYGMRKVKIPLHAIFIIASCSAVALYISAYIGSHFGKILSSSTMDTVGGCILIALGGWALVHFFRDPDEKAETVEKVRKTKEKVLMKFELKSMGVVIQILKKPMAADLDKSGTITGLEAVLLGIALSLDAFGAGLGASMLGFSPLLLAITVGMMSAFFATSGIKFGSTLGSKQWVKQFSFLPGLLLILIGIWKI